MIKINPVRLLLFLAIVVLPLSADSPIILAGKKSITGDISIATQNVEVFWKDVRIYANYVEYNHKTGTITAKGRVTIATEKSVISGEHLQFQLEEMKGVMSDTIGMFKPSGRFNTKEWRQEDENTQTFRQMDFTTCAQCIPRWKISCSKGKIIKEQYIDMKNVVFKIKNIPVFYFPFLRYPIKEGGRATGFLFPVISPYNERLGFTLKNGFYWAIRPNIDITFYLDYHKKAGLGFGEEFRYLFPDMNGNLKLYLFKHSLIYPQETGNENNGETVYLNALNTDRAFDYVFAMDHTFTLDFLDTKIAANVDWQSDPSLLRLHQKDFEIQKIRRLDSSVYLQSRLSNLLFTISASQRDTYYTQQNSKRSFRTLPAVSLQLNRQELWILPGYLSLSTAYENISREGTVYERSDIEGAFIENADISRFSVIPHYNLNLLKLDWLKAALDLESKHIFYPRSLDPESGAIIDEPLQLNYQTASMTFTGPTFFKIYQTDKSRLKHTIEPRIEARYVTQVDEEDRDRLVSVDRFDYPSYSYIGFSLNSDLLHKAALSDKTELPRQLISYSIAQNYYFDAETANFGRTIKGEYPAFSELVQSLSLSFIKDMTLGIQMDYNHYIKQLARLRFSLSYNRPDSVIRGEVSYNSRVNPYNTNKDYFLNRTYIQSNLKLDIPGFPIRINSAFDYDITAKMVRYGAIIATYDYQCVLLNFNIRFFSYFGTVVPEISVGFSLGDFGVVKDILGFDR